MSGDVVPIPTFWLSSIVKAFIAVSPFLLVKILILPPVPASVSDIIDAKTSAVDAFLKFKY